MVACPPTLLHWHLNAARDPAAHDAAARDTAREAAAAAAAAALVAAALDGRGRRRRSRLAALAAGDLTLTPTACVPMQKNGAKPLAGARPVSTCGT